MLEIKIRGDHPLLKPRPHGQLKNRLHREAAERIKTYYLPRKFTNELFSRYPMIARRRSERYQKWKRWLVQSGRGGSTLPNVLSGNLKWEATVAARVTATQDHGRVYIKTGTGRFMSGSRRGQSYTRSLKQWQRDEIEYLSDQDLTELSEWIGHYYVNEAVGNDIYAKGLIKGAVPTG